MEKANRMLKPLALVMLMALVVSAVAQERPLLDFVRDKKIIFEWEPYLRYGRLRFNDRLLWFGPGQTWMMDGDQRRVVDGAIIRKNGSLYISEQTAGIISQALALEKDANIPRVTTIIIDAGHGGRDPGTIGRHDLDGKKLVLQEKDLVLNVSLALRDLLARRFPARRIILSRGDDIYLSLEERTGVANSVESSATESVLFVSVHVNASLNPAARGFEVWYLPPEYRRDLIDPAKLDSGTKEIAPILNTMLEEEFTVESVLLARHISRNLEEILGAFTENRGIKKETWFVVRKAKMPSVLVEIGFITNREEALRMNDPAYLHNVALGIYNGIVRFVTSFEKGHRKEEGAR
jgi:N-acetylmuramoyl-L-alanine amidase